MVKPIIDKDDKSDYQTPSNKIYFNTKRVLKALLILFKNIINIRKNSKICFNDLFTQIIKMIQSLLIKNITIKGAISKMLDFSVKTLISSSENKKLLGTVSDGDN